VFAVSTPVSQRICLAAQLSGDRGHARWLRGSGPLTRPSTTVLRPTRCAISTTYRRATARPCNLSR